MKLKDIINESALNWKGAFKNFITKKRQTIKAINRLDEFYFIPQGAGMIKVKGENVIVYAVYNFNGNTKAEVMYLQKGKVGTGWQVEIPSGQYNSFKKLSKYQSPNLTVSDFKKMDFEGMVKQLVSKQPTPTKAAAPTINLSDLKTLSDAIKAAKISGPRYAAVWNNNEQYIGVEFPYEYKLPTQKFKDEDSTRYHVDMKAKKIYDNRYSPKYDSSTSEGKFRMDFKDENDLIKKLKSLHNSDKREKVKDAQARDMGRDTYNSTTWS